MKDTHVPRLWKAKFSTLKRYKMTQNQAGNVGHAVQKSAGMPKRGTGVGLSRNGGNFLTK